MLVKPSRFKFNLLSAFSVEIKAAVLLQENQQNSVLKTFSGFLPISVVYMQRADVPPAQLFHSEQAGPNIQAVGIPGIASPPIPSPGNHQLPPTTIGN